MAGRACRAFQADRWYSTHLFGLEPLTRIERELNAAIQSCDLEANLQSLTSGQKVEGATHRLLHYVVDESEYQERQLDFASDVVCTRVLEHEQQKHGDDVIAFISRAAGKPWLASIRGTVFQHYANRALSKGGQFRGRWERHRELGEHDTEFKPSKRCG